MATIYDVARHSGVSPKTVSRVMNGDGPVGRTTREAVEKAISELGYVRSNAARMMRAGGSGVIGVVTGAISTTTHDARPKGLPDLFILQGIQAALATAGKTLMIADTLGRQENVPGLLRRFLEHRVDGLIHVADHHKRVELPDLPAGIPLVLANCFDAANTPAILPDDRAGQHALIRALIGAGHRRIAYVTLRPGMVATELRSRGYRDALNEAGIADDPALIQPGYRDGLPEDGTMLEEVLDRLMALGDPPGVICFGNDEMAMRGYGILRSRGLNIPGDISVAGYDDYRIISETLFPPLTTVGLAYHQIGEAAAQLLLRLIDGERGGDSHSLVAGDVQWRESVRGLTE